MTTRALICIWLVFSLSRLIKMNVTPLNKLKIIWTTDWITLIGLHISVTGYISMDKINIMPKINPSPNKGPDRRSVLKDKKFKDTWEFQM